jgi:hypothetical protein
MISGTQLDPDITSQVFVLDESAGGVKSRSGT